MSNFTQAVKELTGFDEDVSGSTNYVNQTRSVALGERVQVDLNISSTEEGGGSKITKTMVINGNIESGSEILITGKVNGDVNISKGTMVEGTVIGNVLTGTLAISGAVKGDVQANGNIKISKDAIIVGNIKSQNLIVDGKVKGNLNTKDTTEVSETALIAGDITTGQLISDKGSVISGKITTDKSNEYTFSDDIFEIGE